MSSNLTCSDPTFLADVVAGLSLPEKRLPCKYFYDQKGSQLFDQICEQPEYYPTRTELSIMDEYAGDIAASLGERVALVEYGSGSSVKTRWLLDRLQDPVAYVPVEISEEHLQATAAELAEQYPKIDILPVAADFTKPIPLPEFPREPSHLAVYFPGSTIGNFRVAEAKVLLSGIAKLVGQGGDFIIGFDLQKPHEILEAAYNDRKGVTAAFNLNLLHRINEELDGDFNVEQFKHRARYITPDDDPTGDARIEISLVSKRNQQVTIDDQVFEFEKGEAVHTENSHKYSVDRFEQLASDAGFDLRHVWTDERKWFAIAYLTAR